MIEESFGRKKMRAVLVQHDRESDETLLGFLRRDPGIELLQILPLGNQAADSIDRLKPDLLVVNVPVNANEGFQLIQQMGQALPPTIVVSNHSPAAAVAAYQLSVVDYLVPPVAISRLDSAIEKARKRGQSQWYESDLGRNEPEIARAQIALKSGSRKIVVALSDIHYVQARNTQSVLFLPKEQLVVDLSLKELEKKLPPSLFFRISRFTIVRLEAVTSVRPRSHGDQILSLLNHTELVLSRTRRAAFLARFQLTQGVST